MSTFAVSGYYASVAYVFDISSRDGSLTAIVSGNSDPLLVRTDNNLDQAVTGNISALLSLEYRNSRYASFDGFYTDTFIPFQGLFDLEEFRRAEVIQVLWGSDNETYLLHIDDDSADVSGTGQTETDLYFHISGDSIDAAMPEYAGEGFGIHRGINVFLGQNKTSVVKEGIYAPRNDFSFSPDAFLWQADWTITDLDDSIVARDSDDTIVSLDGDDWVDGLGGDDVILGGNGRDTLIGGRGNDYLNGEGSGNRIYGGDGNDSIVGGQDRSFLNGNMGDDSIFGSSKDDTIYGGFGNDTIDAGYGDDKVAGGPGDDFIEAAGGNDTVNGLDGDDVIYGERGNGRLQVGANDDVLFGDGGSDLLVGQDGDDVLTGGASSDTIIGGDGLDFINGGPGFDRLQGGPGNDRFYHAGVFNHGTDWVEDYSFLEGDVLLVRKQKVASDFHVNFAETEGAGAVGIAEAFVIYKPTGQIFWALVDGAEEQIALRIGGIDYELF